jgi:drug/metabolite transporter (DMT)-like permease
MKTVGLACLVAVAVASAIARRAPSRGTIAGIVVGFAGAVLIAAPGGSAINATGSQGVGILLILAAVTSYGFAINLARPLQQRNGALPIVWRAQAVGLLLTAPLGLPAVLAGHWSVRPAAALLALGIGGTCLANVLAATAAGRLGATRASTTTFIMPVVALALGLWVRHEQVAVLSIVGAAVCLGGAWLIRRAAQTPAEAPRSAPKQEPLRLSRV